LVKSALSTGGTSLNSTLVRGEPPKLKTTKFGFKKLETTLYRMLQNVFRHLEPFWRGSRVWRTDKRTDRQTDRQTDRTDVSTSTA